MKPKSLDKKKLRHSFKYAFNGIKTCINNEQNMFIHFTVATIVVIGAILFKISVIEWMLCLVMIALVFAAELINTSIENLCDLVSQEENKFIKVAKDTAAGAVLVFAISAFLIGIMIFVPKIIEVII